MHKQMILAIEENGAYSIQSQFFRANLKTLPPEIDNENPISLDFGNQYVKEASLGGIKGHIEGSISLDRGLEFTREIFISDDGKYIAVRSKILNNRENAIFLRNMVPMALEGAHSLLIDGDGLKDWSFVKACRQKTDVPGYFDFSDMDENFYDAALEGAKIKAGGGVGGKYGDFLNTEVISAEPFFYIKNKKSDKPGVFFGILGQTEHLTNFSIVPSKDKQELDRIVCKCEFDNVQIDPSETRMTHWALITMVENEVTIREEFTGIFAREFGIEKSKKDPLTVFCTWQFYGFDFMPEDLDVNLKALKERPIPIDVIQLDNGWIDKLGDYNANHRFPDGMKVIADKIKEAGYIPGIWTCPTMVMGKSRIAQEHPELMAKLYDGSPAPFHYVEGDAYAVDPTVPYFEEYIKGVYTKLKDWGYTYHKLDFLRSLTLNEDIQFYNRKVNRAQAYRITCEAVRRALGDDAYILLCGGVNDAANAGIADALRTGNDMFGFWTPPDGERWKGSLIKVKQNTIRNYTNLLWSADPDACPIRRRTEVFREGVVRSDLSLGLLTDEEAFSIVATQYLTGGNICICENFSELEDDRRALYRHIIPTNGVFAKILDYSAKRCPNYFFTTVTPKAAGLGQWWTLAVGNWFEEEREITVELDKLPLPEGINEFAVFEFHDQKFYGIQGKNDSLTVKIPPHGLRLFRLTAWEGNKPVILGTDLHFTGGGVEISTIDISMDSVKGTLETSWDYPVTISGLFPTEEGFKLVKTTVKPQEQTDFLLKLI